MSTRCPKRGRKLKADFRRHVEARRINPNKTDKAYILSICNRFYKGCPEETFIKNYPASVAEGRICHYVNEYNKRNGSRSQAAEEEEEYDSEADKDFAAESTGEDESLGDIDTDLEEGKLEDLEYAKVLPGGMQFSLLVGVPRWMYEELYMKACMADEYDTRSAVFQAFDRFFIQPIRKLFPGTSDWIEGTPQIVNLDEECVEGPVRYNFGNARTKGTERIERSKQYQSTMTLQLTPVKKKVVKIEKPKQLFSGTSMEAAPLMVEK
ncbi:hypothetical protein HJC23_005897 [Cyclotella cryptica]|uniref:Uncharacterized protein n=1 Tax=Cyclotella cryptica TaxID=29204 RepID=A0ABD3QYY4_9STRA